MYIKRYNNFVCLNTLNNNNFLTLRLPVSSYFPVCFRARILALLSLMLLICFSCVWDDDIEENPITTLSGLTSQTQRNLVFFNSGEAAVFAGILSQQVSGVTGRMLEIERYDLQPEFFDDSWDICYLAVLSNLGTIISTAEKHDLFKYRGVAQIMMANALGLATDLWGDMPFSKTLFAGSSSYAPAYDSQEFIYEQLFQLLDQGVSDLEEYGGQSFPREDDLFFRGDAEKWIGYANFLRLRHEMHLMHKNGLERLLPLLEKPMFAQQGEGLMVDYFAIDAVNPVSRVMAHYPNQLRASAHMVELLEQEDDPRLPHYFRRNNEGLFVGSSPGERNNSASLINNGESAVLSRTILGSYTEQMFIAAEIYYRLELHQEAMAAFSQAVGSSLRDHRVYSDFWVTQYLENIELSLETIMAAKHVALFLQPESWADWRRTGYPIISVSEGNVTGDIFPRRFPYPQSEFLFNSGNVPHDVSIVDPLWWDVNVK